MKLVLIDNWFHIKNIGALQKYPNVEITKCSYLEDINNLSEYDVVYSPSAPLDIKKYPNTKFIFGPHFSTFPDSKSLHIKGINSVYNQLSCWAARSWSCNTITDGLRIVELPFGVDTHRFNSIKSINERSNVILYYKHRAPSELEFIQNALVSNNISFRIFSYDSRYNEDDYINYLQNTKYCIWLDAHESQGFALQEALSCDVPLLVWNVKSMNQEYGQKYDDIPATTIPYWDERCGEYFYNQEDFNKIFDLFISKLEIYKPREYILDNLSIDKCEEKLIDFVTNKFIL
jgi:hypothetical protein